MQQKVQFIAAVLHEPDLIILDEPFSGLDPVNLEVMIREILRMRDAGRTILLSTHVMEQAQRLCDSVMLVHKGRKVLDGPLVEVLGRADPRTILLELEGEPPDLTPLAFVESVTQINRHHEVRLAAGADAQELLAALVGRCRVMRFEVKRPTLHEVFLESVGGTPESLTPAMTGGEQ
jgi:ABC-2 type transport system ATP-binding protein